MTAALLLCKVALGAGLGFAQEPAAPEFVAVPASDGAPQEPVTVPASAPAERGPGPVAVPYTAPPPGSGPLPQPRPRRLVFAFLPSLTMGISPIPSANVALVFGAKLPASAWVLGYQLTLSSGLAERYAVGVWTHRHHITALRSFARGGRGFASVGGGAAFLLLNPVVEAEGRVGIRFGSKRYGVFAAMVRLGWDIGHRERAPMPQFGLVFGVALM